MDLNFFTTVTPDIRADEVPISASPHWTNCLRALCQMALTILLSALVADAQSRANLDSVPPLDPRGAAKLVVCSQNLENFGTTSEVRKRVSGFTDALLQAKIRALVQRFERPSCDVIAVQEVLGDSDERALEGLKLLAAGLHAATNRFYESVVGPTNDQVSHLGFLIAKDKAEIENKLSYLKVELPKLTDNEKPRFFNRAPLELQLRVKSQGKSEPKLVTIINFHFKSKHGAQRDPTSLGWETYRMQMAEAVRQIVEQRHKDLLLDGRGLLLVVGDRNSNFDTASAAILQGVLPLSRFKGEAACRLTTRGVPLCHPEAATGGVLFSLLKSDPEMKQQPGTYVYKGTYSWLDDILAPLPTTRAAWTRFDEAGNFNVGVVRQPIAASDHALVYAVLNW